MKTFATALRATLVTLVLTGILYPLAVTGLAQALFPSAANGSLLKDETGRVVGSRLLGQAFSSPGYFQPRPSAAGNGYDGLASGGSNLGPTAAKLRDRVKTEMDRLARDNPNAHAPVPAELVTTSGSGLDPHISPEAARWQLDRVAHARAVSPDRIAAALEATIVGRDLGFLGEPTVNVLEVNLALDRQFGSPPPASPQGTAAN
jgi:potassium-transporting ATPase KdpC subunit